MNLGQVCKFQSNSGKILELGRNLEKNWGSWDKILEIWGKFEENWEISEKFQDLGKN